MSDRAASNAPHEATVRTVHPARAGGTVTVPSSKSHTIRALLIAGCADGTSRIENVLDSADAASCMAALSALGVAVKTVHRGRTGLTVEVTPPTGGMLAGAATSRNAQAVSIDVGNSGTTLYLLTALATLRRGAVCFDGDASIRRRSAAPLLAALRALGAQIEERGQPGCAPYCVAGPLAAGRTVAVKSPTSQFLSALLLTAPLVPPPTTDRRTATSTVFNINLLHEHPYVDMTCWWLDRQGVTYERRGYERFRVAAGQRYRPVREMLPGDYSSATFWFAAAAVTGGKVTVRGLAPDDVQGDRGVLDILRELGCAVDVSDLGITVAGRPTRGGRFDLNAMPDALPALAVVATVCPQRVELVNVPQAREKETDRIAVMARELRRLGAAIEELPDGLVVSPSGPSGVSGESGESGGSGLSGGTISSHGDHRVAMAGAIAALAAAGPVTIEGADAAAVTYPTFFEDLAAVAPGSVVDGDVGRA